MPAGFLAIVKLADGVPDCASLTKVDADRPRRHRAGRSGARIRRLQRCRRDRRVAAGEQPLRHRRCGDRRGDRRLLRRLGRSRRRSTPTTNGALSFTGSQAGRKREPDAVQWIDNDRFVSANEGDYEGGSRGFTVFNKDGSVALRIRPVLRIRGHPRRPLSGQALRRQGRRARGPRGRDLRRHHLRLRPVRARLGRRRLQASATAIRSSPSSCRPASPPKAPSPSRRATCWSPPTKPISSRMAAPAAT